MHLQRFINIFVKLLKYSCSIIKVLILEKPERRNREMTMILAGVAFVGLFCAWVILPSILKKRHTEKSGTELEAEK
jgi:hypothetical protein